MSLNNEFLNESVELSVKKVNIILLDIEAYDANQLYHFLSDGEKQRANTLKIELKKNQFIISRSILRKIISNSIGKSNEEINIHYSEHNKPYIKDKINNKTIEFNISHSEQCILIALSLGNKVGVDIEKMNMKIDYESLSNRFFSNKESEYLKKIGSNKRLEAFYTLWTRKEAFIKATGEGIAYGLDKFSVASDTGLKSKVDIKKEKTATGDWFCFDLMSMENYKTALSTNNKAVELIFYQ